MVRASILLSLLLGPLSVAVPAVQQVQPPSESQAQAQIDSELAEKLAKVKRIYVESFGDDAISKQLQAMVISSLAASKRFIITENKDKADAVLKGIGLEKTSQELHSSGEATSVGTAGGSASGSNGSFIARKMGIADSQASTETIDDARLSVRLVSSDGDVIWTTTKESKGAKYKGASADVADQIVKQLLGELDKLGTAKK